MRMINYTDVETCDSYGILNTNLSHENDAQRKQREELYADSN